MGDRGKAATSGQTASTPTRVYRLISVNLNSCGHRCSLLSLLAYTYIYICLIRGEYSLNVSEESVYVRAHLRVCVPSTDRQMCIQRRSRILRNGRTVHAYTHSFPHFPIMRLCVCLYTYVCSARRAADGLRALNR